MRLGVSFPALRSVSVGGDPMRNSTGPSITAKVCPWLVDVPAAARPGP